MPSEHAPWSEIVAWNLLCSPSTLAAILVYCSVRDWTRFLRHRIKKYPDSPVHTLSDSLRIYFFPLWPRPHIIGFVADIFFPLWRADLFFSGFAVEIAGYVWTVVVSGKKKLRIRKYPDTCGRGLTKHRKTKKGRGWTKLERIEMDCI